MSFQPDFLRNLRDVKNLSKLDLARLAGVSHTIVLKAESGKNVPMMESLAKLAATLDCTTDYLIGIGPSYNNAAEAATHMSFEAFARIDSLSDEERSCWRRVLSHPKAPRTVEEWRTLKELAELGCGIPRGGSARREEPARTNRLRVAKPRRR